MLTLSNRAKQIVAKAESDLLIVAGYPIRLHAYPQASPYMPKLRQIIAEHFCILESDLYGNLRLAEVVKARHSYWWICYNHLGLSLPAIAIEIGRNGKRSTNHTTVLHGVNSIDNYLTQGQDPICDSIEVICKELKQFIAESKKAPSYEV